MRTRGLFLGLGLLVGAAGPAAASDPADSVVKVSASVRYPNPTRPRVRSDAVEVAGSGVVVEGERILTAAHLVMYAAEVTVQPRPGGEKYTAKVEAVAPDIDLALLCVDDNLFETRPALKRIKQLPPVQAGVTVYGFSVGGGDRPGARLTRRPRCSSQWSKAGRDGTVISVDSTSEAVGHRCVSSR